jgi:repressor LexA
MCHLKALEKKGYIHRSEKKGDRKGKRPRAQARGIYIPGVTAGGFSLPYLGVVAAGQAIEAENIQERLELRDLFGGDDLFVVKVRGHSMIDGHIQDGDYVVIRRKESCDNGDKVVVMIDKAMTLKKYFRRRDQIRLEPMNDQMEPIIVNPANHEIQILGVLEGVIRRY